MTYPAKTNLPQSWIDAAMRKYPMRVEGEKLHTGLVRVMFPTLTEKARAENIKKAYGDKWGIGLLYPGQNMDVAIGFLKAAIRKHYPALADNPAAVKALLDPMNKDNAIRNQSLRVNVADGGADPVKKTTQGFTPGYYFSNPKSGPAYPIQCFRVVAGQWVPIPAADHENGTGVYGGCWGFARLSAVKSGNNKPGIFFGIDGFWKLADDINFGAAGGRASAADGGEIDMDLVIEDPNAGAIHQSNPAPGDRASAFSDDDPWG